MPRRSLVTALSLLPCGLLLTACGNSFQLVKPEIEVSGMIPADWQEENKLSIGNPLPSGRAKVIVTFEASISDLESLQEFEMRLDDELLDSGVGFVDGNEIERNGDRLILNLICYGPRKAPLKKAVESGVEAAGLNRWKIR